MPCKAAMPHRQVTIEAAANLPIEPLDPNPPPEVQMQIIQYDLKDANEDDGEVENIFVKTTKKLKLESVEPINRIDYD